MANTKSAAKRARQTERRTIRNKSAKTRLRGLRKKVATAVESGDEAAVAGALNAFVSAADRAGKTGLLHRKTVDRIKSRAAQACAKAKAS